MDMSKLSEEEKEQILNEYKLFNKELKENEIIVNKKEGFKQAVTIIHDTSKRSKKLDKRYKQ